MKKYITKKIFIALGIVLIVVIGLFGFIFSSKKSAEAVRNSLPIDMRSLQNLPPITVTSTAFPAEGSIPDVYTCRGKNMSPPLEIGQVPTATKSLVLIVTDPDVPVVGKLTHWLVYNLDPNTHQIAEGVLPAGAEVGLNSTGKKAYMGPCPPYGTHQYFFQVAALDTVLEKSDMDTKTLQQKIQGHILAVGELIGKSEK